MPVIPIIFPRMIFTGRGLQTDSYHGMAAAEVVHGLAPEATLYLLKIMDEETLA